MSQNMSEDMCTGGLIRATLGSCACNDNESIEGNAKRGDADNNERDDGVDLPQISRESTTEEQQSDLQHQRQRLHHMVEVPVGDSIEFALSILAALDSSPSHVG